MHSAKPDASGANSSLAMYGRGSDQAVIITVVMNQRAFTPWDFKTLTGI
jgi:hypothetical protein